MLATMMLLLVGATGASAQATLLEASGGGYGGEPGALSSTDDGFERVSITDAFPNGILLNGTTYDSAYIGTNGYVTFGHGNSSYSPEGIAGYTAGPIVAPQFDDLNPANGGTIHYFQSVPSEGRPGVAVITWNAVAPYSAPAVGSGTNTFQAVLRQSGGSSSQDFEIEFRYAALNWTGGYPGNADFSTAGWSLGDQVTYGEVPYSGTTDFLSALTESNVGESGVYRWNVLGGVVESAPNVSTGAVSSLTSSGATVAGNVTGDGGATVTGRGVVYATTPAPTLSDYSVVSGSGTGVFSADLSGLVPGTTYYVRAFATNAVGTAYGAQETFTTTAITAPSVTTGAVSDVTSSGASVAGEVTGDGGAAVSARGVVYATTASPTLSDASVPSGSGTGAFSAELADLEPGTTYYVRAYATNAEGTSYGAEASFSTVGVPPTVVTGAVSGVTTDGGTVSAEVTDDGGLTITDRGVVFAASPSPTLADAVVQSGTGVGSFTADLGGLEPGQTYYARAYATNALGTSYGDEVAIAVDRLTQTIDFASLEGRVYGAASVALQATASSGLQVTFASSDEGVAAVDGGSFVVTGAGEVVITATQAGDGTYFPAPAVQRTLTVERRPVTGTFTIQDPKAYDGETDADVLTRGLVGVLPADVGEVTLTGGAATFADAELGAHKTVTLAGASLSGARAAHYQLVSVENTTGSIVTGAPYTVRLEGPDALVAGVPGTYTVTLLDAYGHPTTTDGPLTFALASSLEGAGSFEPATVTIGAGGSSGTFTYTSTTAADAAETLSLDQTGGPVLPGGALPTLQAIVSAAAVDHFTVDVDEAVAAEGATVGSEVLMRVTARDAFGNLVPTYNGTAVVSSDTDLSTGGGTTRAFVNGVLEAHAVVFADAGTTAVTVAADVGGQPVTGTSSSFQTRFAEAQLAIALVTDEARPALGSEITLEVVVTNEGWTVAGNVVVDDPLAEQERLEALEVQVDQGSVDETSGAWTIDTLASGATATMTIRARVVQP